MKCLDNVHVCALRTQNVLACENVSISIECVLLPFSLHQLVSIGFNWIELSIEELYSRAFVLVAVRIYSFLFPKNNKMSVSHSFRRGIQSNLHIDIVCLCIVQSRFQPFHRGSFCCALCDFISLNKNRDPTFMLNLLSMNAIIDTAHH